MHVSPSLYLRVNPSIKIHVSPSLARAYSPPLALPLDPTIQVTTLSHLLFNCISNKQLSNLPYLLLVALPANPLPLPAGLLEPLVMPP